MNGYLITCPYLPLLESFHFADWTVGPLEAFDDRWPDSEFGAAAKALVTAYRNGKGEPLDRPSIVVHDNGISESPPANEEMRVVQLSLHLAVLDRNPHWKPDADIGHFTFTSDNSDVFAWRIIPDDDFMTLQRGSMVAVTSMGHRLSDPDFTIPPPLELYMPMTTANLDGELLEACGRVLSNSWSPPELQEQALRLGVCIDWLAKSWRNTTSIGWEDRVIFIKTGFEAFTGAQGVSGQQEQIRALFESFADRISEGGELIWTPDEKPEFQHPDDAKTLLTPFEHWFVTFNQVRNRIIHHGEVPGLVYEVEGSAYNGPYSQIGPRILRTLIKLRLEDFGFKNLWHTTLWRTISQSLEQFDLTDRS